MVEIACVPRKWGSSLGIIIPRDIVEKEHILPGKELIVDIKKHRTAGEFFGIRHIADIRKLTEEVGKEWM